MINSFVKINLSVIFLIVLSELAYSNQSTSRPTDQLTTSQPTEFIMYNGKPRSKQWFERIWKRLGKYLIIVNGKVEDIRDMEGQNRLVKITGRIIQVIDNNSCLFKRFSIEAPWAEGTFSGRVAGQVACSVPLTKFDIESDTPNLESVPNRLSGIDTKGLIDNKSNIINEMVIHDGTYKYQSIDGAKRTVDSYTFPIYCTKDIFEKEIRNGMLVYDWKKLRVQPNTRNKGMDDGLIKETIEAKGIHDKTKIFYYRMRSELVK